MVKQLEDSNKILEDLLILELKEIWAVLLGKIKFVRGTRHVVGQIENVWQSINVVARYKVCYKSQEKSSMFDLNQDWTRYRKDFRESVYHCSRDEKECYLRARGFNND